MLAYKLKAPTLKSRRGDYNVVVLEQNPMRWTPEPLNMSNKRHVAVTNEILYAQQGLLATHAYWENEPLAWILAYERLYNDLFTLDWLYNNDDRHSLVVNAECCLTLVQYHNHKLIAYSRSTDMRNGFHSDKLILNYLAQQITKFRPDCEVKVLNGI